MAFGFGRKPKADVEAGNATRHRATTTTPPRKGLFSVDADDLHSAAQEFLGTALFIMLGLGGIQAASTQWGAEGSATSNGASGSLSASPPPSVERLVFFLYVSLSLGFSLLVSAWMFFRVTGGLFNPNVSLALCIVGVISPIRLFLYTIAQFSGAIAGAALVRGLTPGPTPPLVLK
jgi:aquaporin related protein